VRASTAFKRILRFPDVQVSEVVVGDEEVVIKIRLKARRPRCGTCATPGAVYDHRHRRWRHLDALGHKVYLEADLARVTCKSCGGVRTQEVPFAEVGGRYTAAFASFVVWSVRVMDKSAASRAWRISWSAVDGIVARAVDAPGPPQALRAIGVDERSWGRGKALTVVVDHDSGAVIWAAEGTTKDTFLAFFDWIGPEVAKGIRLVSMDMARAYIAAVRARVPQARICFDPFHVVRIVNRALDTMRRGLAQVIGVDRARRLRRVLLSSPRKLRPEEKDQLAALAEQRRIVFDAWRLKEELADLYRLVAPEAARDYLDAWITKARASRITVMVHAAGVLARHAEGIVAAVEENLSNSRLEGFNNKIALINRRGYGHRNLEAFLKVIYLCCGGTAAPASPWEIAGA